MSDEPRIPDAPVPPEAAASAGPADDLFLAVRRIVCEAVREESEKLDPAVSLVDEYHIDSMMALGIMVALEKAFDLYIPEDEIAEFDTLAEIVELTRKYVAMKAAGTAPVPPPA